MHEETPETLTRRWDEIYRELLELITAGAEGFEVVARKGVLYAELERIEYELTGRKTRGVNTKAYLYLVRRLTDLNREMEALQGGIDKTGKASPDASAAAIRAEMDRIGDEMDRIEWDDLEFTDLEKERYGPTMPWE